jgi:hypothetical protein
MTRLGEFSYTNAFGDCLLWGSYLKLTEIAKIVGIDGENNLNE